MILDGAAVAATRRAALKQRVTVPLSSGIILATDDPSVRSYVSAKRRAAEEVGYAFVLNDLGANASREAILAACREWNQDPEITAYMVQTPLPPGINRLGVFAAVDPQKDSDGLNPTNLGYLFSNQERVIPATPKGILSLLEAYDIPISGQVAAVIGKSILVGLPVAALLANRGATVISCDSHTPDLPGKTRQADLIIAAAGRPGLVTAGMVAKGAVVVDVGITRVGGKLVGDVDFDGVSQKAAAVTPVPGGVGPMTVVSLLENVYELAAARGLGTIDTALS